MMSAALKSRLRSRKLTFGSWVTIGDTSVAEIMAKAGFDWLTIDMEHSAITLDQTQRLLQVIGLSGVTPLVRVGENDPTVIKRVMDAGAHGVIVPMVNTREDAAEAVNSVKYPPLGKRGVGLTRAQGYGLEFEKYKKWVNQESIVIVQIEHIEAVDNLEEILAVDGIDAFVVGPYDLSASMGKPGEFNNQKVKRAMSRIMEVAKKYDVTPGFHVVTPDVNEVSKKIKEGYRFIGFSFDALLLGTICKEGIAKIRQVLRK